MQCLRHAMQSQSEHGSGGEQGCSAWWQQPCEQGAERGGDDTAGNQAEYRGTMAGT